MARQQRDVNLQMYQLVEKSSIKLEKNFLNFRKCFSGRVIHFDVQCPHWRDAKCIEMRKVCKGEEAVIESVAQPTHAPQHTRPQACLKTRDFCFSKHVRGVFLCF